MPFECALLTESNEANPGMSAPRAFEMEPVKLPAGINPRDVLRTPNHNPYTPNQNQTKHCYHKYNEFFRCERFKGEGAKECFQFKQAYFSLCPNEWVEKWDEQRAEGKFPGPQ